MIRIIYNHVAADLYVACDDNLFFHLLNISSRCLLAFRGQLLSMSSTSTVVSKRLVERRVCHSEKHSVSWTRWASAHGTSRRWAGNLNSCSSRLTPTTTPDTPPSAIDKSFATTISGSMNARASPPPFAAAQIDTPLFLVWKHKNGNGRQKPWSWAACYQLLCYWMKIKLRRCRLKLY